MMPTIHSGQYIGSYTNVNTGLNSLICLNIDSADDGEYEIFSTIFAGQGLLYTASFRITDNNIINHEWIKITEIDEYERTETFVTRKDRDHRTYHTADLLVTNQNGLRINWKLPDGTECQSSGLTNNRDQESTLSSQSLSWDEFRSHVTTHFAGRKYVFRGQRDHHRLRTSFHRTQRANIGRYFRDNIPALQRYINAIYPDFIGAENDYQILSLLTLLQHHGYPTPILDWTMSPYIAAYFAFFETTETDPGSVQILAFDRDGYSKDFPQFNNVSDMNLHISFHDTPTLHNPRCIPQQSVSCISTIDDIEKYIEIQESTYNRQYLKAFSIPKSDATRALNELHLMGINHATLFPGLDGICRYMKYEHFG